MDASGLVRSRSSAAPPPVGTPALGLGSKRVSAFHETLSFAFKAPHTCRSSRPAYRPHAPSKSLSLRTHWPLYQRHQGGACLRQLGARSRERSGSQVRAQRFSLCSHISSLAAACGTFPLCTCFASGGGGFETDEDGYSSFSDMEPDPAPPFLWSAGSAGNAGAASTLPPVFGTAQSHAIYLTLNRLFAGVHDDSGPNVFSL